MADEVQRRETNRKTSHVGRLIGARLLATLLVLMAGAVWSPRVFLVAGQSPLSGINALLSPRLIVVIIVALSLVYTVMLRFAWLTIRMQARVQLLADALLVTWFVWTTGDLRSPYTAFYIIIISAASIFLGARGAMIVAVGCATAYTLVMVGVVTEFLPAYAPTNAVLPIQRAVEIIGLNVIGFLVVGLLAARLAANKSRADVELTEATHALANLRALHERIVESIRSGVMTTDLQGRIYTFNKAAEEITGYDEAEMRGREASFLFGEQFNAQIAETLRAPTEEDETSLRYEADCPTSDGLRLRLGYSISPLVNGQGKSDYTDTAKPSGLVVTFQDLTQVRALEQSSRRQDRLAAVGRVAAGIAHEIRNPLASMRGAIQVLRADMEDDSSQAELMEIILRESDRLNRIIADFLTYARPKHGEFKVVDVREPLHETFTLLRHSPELFERHRLEEDVPDEPVNATADAALLRQVFWNLARNALQAMADGGTLRVEMRNLPNGRVRIMFSDTGFGMTPEQVERLFEPFANSTTGGTGLGLPIVYQIIRDHNGTINVRSRPQQGTTITIELPGTTKNFGVEKLESEVEKQRLAVSAKF